jgi:hypothetical protein
MKVGDRVKFRRESKAWKSYGLEPDAKGYVVEIFQDPETRGGNRVDVRFPGTGEPEHGIDTEELEILD